MYPPQSADQSKVEEYTSAPLRMSKYEVLGVKRSALLQEIKVAYQAAALATHPDKQAGLATDDLKTQVMTLWSGTSKSLLCSAW